MHTSARTHARDGRQMRKHLTGDENMKLRVWAQARYKKVQQHYHDCRCNAHARARARMRTRTQWQAVSRPPVIMLMDKASFLMGVLALVFAEAIFLRVRHCHPHRHAQAHA